MYVCVQIRYRSEEFLVLPRLKKWGARISWLMLATAALISFWGLMMSSGFGGGDFANIAYSLGIPKFVFGILGIGGLVGFMYLVAKQMLGVASEYLPMRSFSNRAVTLLLFFGLPVTAWVLGYFLISSRYAILGQFVFVVVILVIISGTVKTSTDNFHDIPRLSTYTGAAAFVVSCVIWLAVFGLTLQSAKGIFWGG